MPAARLEQVAGPNPGARYPLDQPVVIIGRGEGCGIALNDIVVSRRHAQLTATAGGHRLEDCGSRFGTFLNDQPVQQAELKDGDLIVIGRYRLKYVVEAAPAATDELQSELVSKLPADAATLVAPKTESLEAFRSHTLRLKALLDLATALQGNIPLPELLNRLLDHCCSILKPDRAYVLLRDAAGEVRAVAARTCDSDRPDLSQLTISRTIVQAVVERREAMITTDAMTDQRFAAGMSIHDFSIRSAMCAPLIHGDRVVGLIHVDNQGLTKCFSHDDLELLVALAGAAGSAVGNALLTDQVREHERVRGNLSRFLSPAVIEQVVGQQEKLTLAGERRQVSILFTDIRNFTALSQTLDVERVVLLLNHFFTMAVSRIFAEGGTLDKFLGDGLMAIYGAPVVQPDAVARAVRTATAIAAGLAEFNEAIENDGLPPVGVGLAVATGEAIVGTVGSPERLEYTAIGSTVNLAARLVGIARAGQVLIDATTAAQLPPGTPVTDLGEVEVKGFSRKIRYHQVGG